MGIRESFEQHPSGEDLNIHDIVIKDEKRETLPFDPEKEISDEDWQEMKDELETARARGYKKGAWLPFFRLAADMKIIFPERAEELKLDANIRQAVIDVWYSPEDRPMIDVFEYARNIKIIFPNFDLRTLYNPGMLEHMRERTKESAKEDFAIEVSKMAVGFPKTVKELGLDEKTWQTQKKILEQCRQNKKWYKFIPRASSLKILFPEKVKELGLDEEAWYGMKDELRKWRGGGEIEFAKVAAHLKILSAYEVKITDRGIECVMYPPKSFRESKKPRPERRQF